MSKKLKGVKKLNKKVTKALSAFNVNAKMGEDFSYFWEKELVTFPVLEWNEFGSQCLVEFIKDRFDVKDVDPFTTFLLHEVGHHMANDEMEGAVGQFCWDEKERIEKELADCAEDDLEAQKRLHYQYYNLPEEIMATQWAINFIKKNPKKANKILSDCKKAIYEFYEKNLDKEEFM
jgi:hypothetical protein